jgi:hypothetical protein
VAASPLDRDSAQALQALYKKSAIASDISKHAKAVLVFPNIIEVQITHSFALERVDAVAQQGQRPGRVRSLLLL